jgi:Tol biopolymer transport system component
VRPGWKVLGAAALVVVLASTSSAARVAADTRCTLDRATGTTIDAKPFMRKDYGTRWNLATDRIAFVDQNAAGYYRVFTMKPDGSERRALSAGRSELPPGHHGMVFWHPSGRYVLFTAQKAEWHGLKLFGNPDYEALPGFGRHDDMWLLAADGSRSWQLTNEPNTRDEGVLLPVFSADGKRIAWSSRQPGGTYVLKVAAFSETPQPHLGAVRSYAPGGATYYETGSFSSDGRSLMYTSAQDTKNFWASQIYRLDLATGKSTRLTTGNAYNEHPIVVATPTGDWIVYMSTKGVRRRPGHLTLGTDWYAMRLDGSGAKRLTTMNVNDKSNPEDAGVVQVAVTVAVSPTGDFMLGDVQDNLARQTGFVRVVRFVCR